MGKRSQGVIVQDEKTLKTIANLAGIGATNGEIAAVLGIGLSTVEKHVTKKDAVCEAIMRGRGMAAVTLRRAQWKAAVEMHNATMLIWLGKQMLGQCDAPSFSAVVTDEATRTSFPVKIVLRENKVETEPTDK